MPEQFLPLVAPPVLDAAVNSLQAAQTDYRRAAEKYERVMVVLGISTALLGTTTLYFAMKASGQKKPFGVF